MSSSVAESMGRGRVNGVDTGTAIAVNKVDPEMPIDAAKVQIGGAFRDSVRWSDGVLKEFGDKGRVSRVCSGEDVPDWLARAWARPRTRRALVLALAEASGVFDVRLQITERVGLPEKSAAQVKASLK